MAALLTFLGHCLPTNLIDWYSALALGISGQLLAFALAYRRAARFEGE